MAEKPGRGLTGCCAWVTRPREQSAELCALIRARGGEPVEFPLTEIVSAPAPAAARAELRGIARHHCCVFVSRNAVRFALELCPDLAAQSGACRFFAVGAGTASELSRAGMHARTGPGPAYGSDDLLGLPELQSDSVQGRPVLIVRGVGGEATLRNVLSQRGASVREAEVYRRRRIELEPARVDALWQQSPPDVIVLTSAGGARYLIELTPAAQRGRLLRTALAVISGRVGAAARRAGFSGVIEVADAATDRGLCDSILAWRGRQ